LLDVVVVASPDRPADDLVHALAGDDLTVESASTPEGVARLVVGRRPDVVIVDLRDAGAGESVADRLLRWLCRHATAAAIVVTQPAQVDARIRALQFGAVDHLVAPIEHREVTARVAVQLARRRAGRDSKIEAGDISIDLDQRIAIRDGKAVSLTPRELALLVTLAGRRGETVSKQELLGSVWRGEIRSENVVESNVSSLRRKLRGLGPDVIHTVHRGGYIFRPVTSRSSIAHLCLVGERDRMPRP
jgi:DNA-binding response OmpR family regulator